MKAVVKSIELINYENWDYWPYDPTNFCIAAEALIGVQGSDGKEIFSFEVCSPRWLVEHGQEEAYFVRHIILMAEYDEARIKN